MLPLNRSEKVKPKETAGSREPPDKLPMVRPPTVIHEPIAKPKYSESGDFVVAQLKEKAQEAYARTRNGNEPFVPLPDFPAVEAYAHTRNGTKLRRKVKDSSPIKASLVLPDGLRGTVLPFCNAI